MKWLFSAAVLASVPASAQGSAPYEIHGDAIPASLTGQVGDPARGEKLMGDRHRSLCSLCHSGPFAEPHMQGTIAPDLSGLGSRLSEGQIRLRVANIKALNPQSLMPSYLEAPTRADISEDWRGKPILEKAEIEDIVAYLVTLKE